MAETTAPASIDPAEIEKFGALAAHWWDPKGPLGALHRMNPVRLGYLKDKAKAHFGVAGLRPLAGLTALDIGCGGGLVSEPLARMGAAVTAIDGAAEAIGVARAHGEAAGLTVDYRVATAEELAAGEARFDLVTALEIIEHVADVNAFLGAAAALVKPGGLIVLSTINRTQKARALAIVAAEKVLRWAPEGAHEYEKLVTPEEIRHAAPDVSWDEPAGMSFDPLGKGWSLSRDISMNYLMAGIRGGLAARDRR
jgi:2-polyprenyl-6-hydroxyphenyl methylase/3-demethylubiquinone-9 3-methyltransferase